MSCVPTTTNEDLSLPAPSGPSTPLDLTPSTTPVPHSRDPIIQRNAVFGERYLTDPTKVYDYNSWDQVLPDPDHLSNALEKVKLQKEARVPEKEMKRFLDRPAYFWDLFYRNNRENFFKNRKWLVREFQVLGNCLQEDVRILISLSNSFFLGSLRVLNELRVAFWVVFRDGTDDRRRRELFSRLVVELGMPFSRFWQRIRIRI